MNAANNHLALWGYPAMLKLTVVPGQGQHYHGHDVASVGAVGLSFRVLAAAPPMWTSMVRSPHIRIRRNATSVALRCSCRQSPCLHYQQGSHSDLGEIPIPRQWSRSKSRPFQGFSHDHSTSTHFEFQCTRAECNDAST